MNSLQSPLNTGATGLNVAAAGLNSAATRLPTVQSHLNTVQCDLNTVYSQLNTPQRHPHVVQCDTPSGSPATPRLRCVLPMDSVLRRWLAIIACWGRSFVAGTNCSRARISKSACDDVQAS